MVGVTLTLYLIHSGRSRDITYTAGQQHIVHLEADLNTTVNWATQNQLKWVFTDSNAGSYYFNEYGNLVDLNKLRWESIFANQWSGEHKEGKQAEFLLENRFPWHLIENIGVINTEVQANVTSVIANAAHQPNVVVQPSWYY